MTEIARLTLIIAERPDTPEANELQVHWHGSRAALEQLALHLPRVLADLAAQTPVPAEEENPGDAARVPPHPEKFDA